MNKERKNSSIILNIKAVYSCYICHGNRKTATEGKKLVSNKNIGSFNNFTAFKFSGDEENNLFCVVLACYPHVLEVSSFSPRCMGEVHWQVSILIM